MTTNQEMATGLCSKEKLEHSISQRQLKRFDNSEVHEHEETIVVAIQE